MKILMLTSALDLGGAETHVAALSRELRQLGHTVCLCSSGGRLADTLSQEGFSHRTLPLHSTRPKDLSFCMRALSAMLETEGFDVVHAHARLPAYLVGRVRRRIRRGTGFRFCVTCHAAFRSSGLYRRLSEWGDGTIAVSEDLKGYLVGTYGLYPDRVEVIPNGVEISPALSAGYRSHALLYETATELAPPEPVAGRDMKRFSAAPTEEQTVLFLSRLDGDCSLTAELLISLAPRLRMVFPQLRIRIAGGGSEYERLSEMAEEFGVEMMGAVENPGELLRDCTVFVGVSRGAMEAMAAGCPVILSGNEGYLGILEEATATAAELTNYTCRGYQLPEQERLYADLVTLLSAHEEERRELGRCNRERILAGHSAGEMAARTVMFYQTLPYPAGRKKGILIGGYFGYGNTGDDAIAEVLVQEIRQRMPAVPVTLLTRNPRADSCQYATACANRTSPVAIRRAMRRCNLYISGSGSLYQNLTSGRSLSYYLGLLKLAQRKKIPSALLSAGIGPLRGERAKKKTGKVLLRASYLGLREEKSISCLQAWGAEETRLFLGADPALLLQPASAERIAYLRMTRNLPDPGNLPGSGGMLAVALKGTDGYGREKLAAVLRAVCGRCGLTPWYFPLFPAEDAETCRLVCRAVGYEGQVIEGLTPREILGFLSSARLALTSRLHLMVFSSAAGIPAVGLTGCDPKLAAFAETAGMPSPLGLYASTPERIATVCEKILASEGKICHNVKEQYAQLCRRAEKDLSEVLSLFLQGTGEG